MLLLAAKRGVPIIATTALLNKGKREESLIIIMEEKMRKILLYSSALVVGLSGVAEAACIQTPSCSSLGYSSSSSCSGGTKCPFGNYWNCDAINKVNSINSQITNLTNKITTLETKVTELQKDAATANCKIGDILYSDMSCNTNVVISKTPIGVIFDVTNKLAIGLEESSSSLRWSDDYFDVPGVDNIGDSTLAITDWDGKKNTSTILAYCRTKGKSCPAFEYVNSYKTEGTQAGDWYLPALGELNAIYGNKDALDIALRKIGGTKLGAGFHWSSSEYSNRMAWVLHFDGSVNYFTKGNDNNYVRPVLAF